MVILVTAGLSKDFPLMEMRVIGSEFSVPVRGPDFLIRNPG